MNDVVVEHDFLGRTDDLYQKLIDHAVAFTERATAAAYVAGYNDGIQAERSRRAGLIQNVIREGQTAD